MAGSGVNTAVLLNYTYVQRILDFFTKGYAAGLLRQYHFYGQNYVKKLFVRNSIFMYIF